MDKPILKDSLRLFQQFGKVKSRSMFGGFGFFLDDAMFALVVNGSLCIRASETTSDEFKALGYEPYVYTKRGFPVVTKYFMLPCELWENKDKILEMAEIALDSALSEKKSMSEEKNIRLKDLPNLRLTTERLLKKAGISSVVELRDKGAVEAFKAIRRSQTNDLNIELLWALEGALNGTHWSVIPQERRLELTSILNS